MTSPARSATASGDRCVFGSVLSGVGAYLSVRFLTRYLSNRSLRPFGIYCIAAGVASLIWLAVR